MLQTVTIFLDFDEYFGTERKEKRHEMPDSCKEEIIAAKQKSISNSDKNFKCIQ
jgi:hypothetical protein